MIPDRARRTGFVRLGSSMLLVAFLCLGGMGSFDAIHRSSASIAQLPTASPTVSAISSPSPRWDAGLAYDARDGYVVLFGGETTASFQNDTWTYVNGTWANISQAQAPSQRVAPDMIYDGYDRYVLLFGGYYTNAHGSQFLLNDTWAFANGTWSRIRTTTAPPVSPGFGEGRMAYDVADHCVYLLTGGAVGLWTYRAGVWSPAASVAGNGLPPPRERGNVVYDPRNGYFLMLEGNRTWTYSGGVWTNFTTSQAPRVHFGGDGDGMVFDRRAGHVVLFGCYFSYSNGTYVDQTWKYGHATWTLVRTLNPPGMYSASLTYDVRDRYVLVFGGIYSNGPSNRVWTLSAGVWS
jgi:hypothetical protein